MQLVSVRVVSISAAMLSGTISIRPSLTSEPLSLSAPRECNKLVLLSSCSLLSSNSHMGISSAPPCGPTEFFCKAAQLALRAGAWTPYAQSSVVPAQYFRNQASMQDYLSHDSFLRDINNERRNDTQPISGASENAEHDSPRNASYAKALQTLTNFVMFAFRCVLIPTLLVRKAEMAFQQ